MKKVSILIPVYNTAPYLKRCLDSIVGQTYENIEIIIVDDGSTDATPEICAEYSRNHANISCVAMPHSGPAGARFKAFELSSGDYIYCVDSDDFIEPDTVATLVNGIEVNDADMFFCRYRLINSRGRTLRTCRKLPDEMLEDYPAIVKAALRATHIKPSLCLKMCKRSLWLHAYPAFANSISYSEDYLISVAFALQARKIGFTNRILYNICYRDLSASRTPAPETVSNHDLIFSEIDRLLEQNNLRQPHRYDFLHGFAKNIFRSLVLAASKSPGYPQFRDIHAAIPENSIFHSPEFRYFIRRNNPLYAILDSLIHHPRLFYATAHRIPFKR